MWQGSGHPSKVGGFPRNLRFSPPRMTTAGRDSSVNGDTAWGVRGTAIEPASDKFFREDLVMKIFLRPFFEKKMSIKIGFGL